MSGNIYDDKTFFDAYAEMGRSRGGLEAAGEWHQLQPLFPDVAGKAVLDLGCGYGWHCRYAAELGAARVVGLDASARMIQRAKQFAGTGEPSQAGNRARAQEAEPACAVEYRVCGIEEYGYPKETYDLVISNLVLHYIEDLESVYRNVKRTLKPGGCFLFNIEHPVFTAGVREDWVYDGNGRPLYWPVDDYYKPGSRETVFLGQKVEKQHHTLTQILNPLLKCGFVLEAVEEALPPEHMMDLPGMADELRRPMMLLIKAGIPC